VAADRTLRAMQRAARERARTARPHQAHRATIAYSDLAQLRREAQLSPEIRSVIERMRVIYRALAGEPKRKHELRTPGRPPAFTTAQFEAACKTCSTDKAIAKKLGVDRATVYRHRARI
jgi:DNA-binding NarL/FixJ family response regulator